MYGLITTAKLNDLEPQAWLADVLTRIAGTPASHLEPGQAALGGRIAPVRQVLADEGRTLILARTPTSSSPRS